MPRSKPVSVLYIEDDEGLAILMQRRLRRLGYMVDLASDGDKGMTKLQSNSWDLLIIDQRMPGQSGLDLIRTLVEKKSLPPSIMITGAGDEKVAVEAMKLGVSDYVIKDASGRYLELMPSIIEDALSKQRLLNEKIQAQEELRKAHSELEKRVTERTAELQSSNLALRNEVSERTRAQESLAVSEARLSAIFETAKDCIFIKDQFLRYILVNPYMACFFGLKPDLVVGKTDKELFGVEAAEHLKGIDLRVLNGETIEEEHTRIINGIPTTFLDVKAPMRDVKGRITGICGISRNITDRSGNRTAGPISAAEYPSKVMRTTMAEARLAAETDSIVLLTGESGTGKDYLAQFIHSNSRHAGSPFYLINCAAVSEELAESELFGHESGAFTGARRRKRGLLELAEGGTILLNEIGDMSLRLQAKLLTFIETKTFTRVGGEKTISVDARILAATNRNLSHEVGDGRFREDLFYRLNVLEIRIPPLRDRLEDIPELVSRLISTLALELHFAGAPEVDPDILNGLAAYKWPGNVRELRNLLERALILSKGHKIELKHFGLPELEDEVFPVNELSETRTYNDIIRETKIGLIENALQKTGGRKQEAAGLLGLSRDALKRQMSTLGLLGRKDL